MFKRILVPVDGSRTSDPGLDAAIRMGKSQKATLYLLHVVDESVLTQNIEASTAVMDGLLQSLRDGGGRILGKAQAKVRQSGLKSKSILLESMTRRVADLIVDQARKTRADVIVMGTHGRRGITRVVMGSDAEEVVRTTPVPVLLVRAGVKKRR